MRRLPIAESKTGDDAYIVKRHPIYLDEEQDRRLGRRAREDGTTKPDVIRRAIGAYLNGPDQEARRCPAGRNPSAS